MATIPAGLANALDDRYRLDRELGSCPLASLGATARDDSGAEWYGRLPVTGAALRRYSGVAVNALD